MISPIVSDVEPRDIGPENAHIHPREYLPRLVEASHPIEDLADPFKVEGDKVFTHQEAEEVRDPDTLQTWFRQKLKSMLKKRRYKEMKRKHQSTSSTPCTPAPSSTLKMFSCKRTPRQKMKIVMANPRPVTLKS